MNDERILARAFLYSKNNSLPYLHKSLPDSKHQMSNLPYIINSPLTSVAMLLKEKQSCSKLTEIMSAGNRLKAHSNTIIASRLSIKSPISNKLNEIKLISLEFYKKLSLATNHKSVMYNKNTSSTNNRTKCSKFGILLRRMSNCVSKMRPLTPSSSCTKESSSAMKFPLPISHKRKIVYLKVK
jgi:hypothetical protein